MTKNIGFLLYDDFQILDTAGPMAAFEIAGRLSGETYALQLLSIEGGMVSSSAGAALPTIIAADARPLDTLIVVGGEGHRQAMLRLDTRQMINAWAGAVRRICSVCSGAFLLAAAGVLNGRRATTHWRQAGRLASLFPLVSVNQDAIYVRDGSIWTAAGITAGIDLALALIAEDLGEAVAQRVAQEMVVYYRRPGGQSQFSALQELVGGEQRFSGLLAWIREHLEKRLTVEVLAAEAAMSPRHFSRTFNQTIGMTPARAVERLRLEAARERVEYSTEPIETIASTTGFNDPERMRRAFIRAFGQPPQGLRRARH